MSDMIKPTPEQKQFGSEIGEKLYMNYRSVGSTISISGLSQVVRDMVAHKLAKEGWSKENPAIELIPR